MLTFSTKFKIHCGAASWFKLLIEAMNFDLLLGFWRVGQSSFQIR